MANNRNCHLNQIFEANCAWGGFFAAGAEKKAEAETMKACK